MNKKIQDLKNKIESVDYILTGSIQKIFKSCGKTTCRCFEDVKYLHGPYYILTRKVKGKTITKTLSEKQAKFCRQAIRNMKLLKKIIDKWKNASIEKI